MNTPVQQTTTNTPQPAPAAANAPQPAAQQPAQNPLMGLLSMMTNNRSTPQAAPQAAPEPAQPQGGGFFGNMLGGIGNMLMPIIAIMGMVFLLPKLLSGGLFQSIGNLFGGLMGGNQPTSPAPSTQGTNTPSAQPVSFTTNSASTSAAKPQVVAAVQDVSAASQALSNDKNKAQWASVDAKGNIIAGNRVNELGDTASTTKAIAAWLVATDPKLKAKGGVTAEMRESMNQMSQVSSNSKSDELMNEVARARGISPDALIREYNQRLDQMGFKHLEIANFSGLPSASDGGFYVSGLRNVSTAYELAVAMQKFGSEAPNESKIFAPSNNHTGMGGVNADAVKTGTALGVIDRASGANKSAVAYRGGQGSIAVMESTIDEWMPTINRALGRLEQNTRQTAVPATTPVFPAATPALNGQRTQTHTI